MVFFFSDLVNFFRGSNRVIFAEKPVAALTQHNDCFHGHYWSA